MGTPCVLVYLQQHLVRCETARTPVSSRVKGACWAPQAVTQQGCMVVASALIHPDDAICALEVLLALQGDRANKKGWLREDTVPSQFIESHSPAL